MEQEKNVTEKLEREPIKVTHVSYFILIHVLKHSSMSS